MNEPDEWDYLIQDYLEDELSPEQRQEVESLRASDPAFQQRMAQYERTYQGLKSMIQAEERKAFDETFSLNLNEPQPLRPNWRRYARIAAVLVPLFLLAGALWWLGQQLQIEETISQEELIASVDGTNRGNGNPENQSLLKQADQAVLSGNFDQALNLAGQISSTDSLNFFEALLLEAKAHLLQNDPKEAVKKLEQLKQLPPEEERQVTVYWYLANGYLELKNWEQARANFQLILGNSINDNKKAEAQAWLDKLNHPLFAWFN